MTVWIVEEIDYEDTYIVGVAASLEAAEQVMMSRYPPPYIVKWGKLPPADSNGDIWMQGQLQAVPGHSPKCSVEFRITEKEVVQLAGDQ